MGGRPLSLDTILSASSYFVRKWSPDLARNQSRDLLRFVICRLYDQGRGKLIGSQLTLAQSTLGRKLGLSRQWVGILLSRLEREGWIQFTAPYIDAGMRGSTIIRIGRQLKRLLVMLAKSRLRKKQARLDDKSAWQFSPLSKEKRLSLIQEKEQELPSPKILKRVPLLQIWLQRGKSTENTTS